MTKSGRKSRQKFINYNPVGTRKTQYKMPNIPRNRPIEIEEAVTEGVEKEQNQKSVNRLRAELEQTRRDFEDLRANNYHHI